MNLKEDKLNIIEPKTAEQNSNSDTSCELCVLGTAKKYNIIYADPPWQYKFPGTRAEKADDYETMKTKNICELNIGELADENAVLFIWIIWTKLPDALEVIKAWGFEYKTVGFVWVKTNRNTATEQFSFLPTDSFDSFWGMGMWTRSNTEVCLIATKGKPNRRSASVHQLIYSPLQKHSKKPDEVRERIIELMGDLPRVELFARQKTDGWDVWGNQVESTIEVPKYA